MNSSLYFSLPSALFLVAAAAALWLGFQRYDRGRSSYDIARSELETAQSLAKQISILRSKPDRAATKSHSSQSLAERIEKAAEEAGVAQERLARIEPQQPRHAGDSDYLEHVTVVQLDGVTLAQMSAALQKLRDVAVGQEPLSVSNLRISVPYQDGEAAGAEVWNVELTLTYYVYSAKSAAPRKP